MNKQRKYFTLIELLVVMAIVSILAALLLPALQMALEKGRRTKCMSMFSQMGNAFTFYASDYGDWLPVRKLRIDNADVIVQPWWHEALWGYVFGKVLENDINPATGASYKGLGIFDNKSTRKSTSRFVCPSFKPPGIDIYYTWGYNMNFGQAFADGRPEILRLDKYRRPSLTNVLTEQSGITAVTAVGQVDKIRHRGTSNVLFVDMHIENMHSAKLYGCDTWTNNNIHHFWLP